MADPNKQPSYVGGSLAIPGKPNDQEFPTPNLRDRILVIRKDGRLAGYKLPLQGSKYRGPNADKFCDFKFATVKSLDQIGWVNWYYVNERKNQDEYNFEITYPYASKDFPTVTRTYVVLRGDQRENEPDADSKDPVYGDLSLTDHKVIRLQQPELDALFVGIQRVYERLPGPIIISDETNQFQQEVTIAEQEDIAPDFPTVTALTESAKLERKTTAKAKTTNATVDVVFPDTNYKVSRDDAVIPYRHRKFLAALPSVQLSQTLAGDAAQPVLADVDWDASDHQTTLYKHQVSRTVRNLTAPIALLEYRLTNDQQLSTVTETWAPRLQSFTPVPLLIEADVIQLGNNESVKSETVVPNVFPKSVYETEVPDPVPLKFRVAIPVTSSTQTSIGTAVPPVLGTGELSKRDEQTTEFWRRLMIKGRDPTQLPVSLVSYELTSEQQIGMITETLAAGLQTLSPNELLIKGSVDNLGNNTSLKSGTVVPNVFAKQEYSTTILDIVPEKFRAALPTFEFSQTIPGTAMPVVLGTGEFERRDQQETAYKHRTFVKARLPAARTVLVSYKMTREKQLETVIETYDSGLQTISPSSLTIEAEVTNLGNNTSISSVGTVSEIFHEQSFVAAISDLMPPEFRAVLPTTKVSVLIEGQANLPLLVAGDISRTETQINEFVFRGETETRAGLALPQVTKNREITSEFGGGAVIRTSTLDLYNNLTLDSGLIVLSSNIKRIDNQANGYAVRTTRSLNNVAWPPLVGTHVDEKYGLVIGITRQTVDAGTAGGVLPDGTIVEVKSHDRWKSIQIASKLDVGSLPEDTIWFSGQRHSFPPELDAGAIIDWAAAFCGCSSSFSAVLIANFHQYTGNVKTRITEQFYAGPPPDDVTITQFFPQAHSFGYAWSSACGDTDGSCRTKSGAPKFYIPLCLHDALDLTINSIHFTFPATTPSVLPHGSYIMLPPQVERWRFGAFRRVLTEVLVP